MIDASTTSPLPCELGAAPRPSIGLRWGAQVSAPPRAGHGVTVVFVNLPTPRSSCWSRWGRARRSPAFLVRNPRRHPSHLLRVDVSQWRATAQAAGARCWRREPKIGAHGKPVAVPASETSTDADRAEQVSAMSVSMAIAVYVVFGDRAVRHPAIGVRTQGGTARSCPAPRRARRRARLVRIVLLTTLVSRVVFAGYGRRSATTFEPGIS